MNSEELKYKVYSFDVFDTTVTRVVAAPKDIFVLMQLRLSEFDPALPSELKENFSALRGEAELTMRKHSVKEDITLNDVYQWLEKAFGLNHIQTEQLKQLELDTEYRSTYPIMATVSEINSLRAAGKRIVFISDMYLPESHIQNVLQKVGAFSDTDRLYVSNAVGLSKGTGNLFKHVLEKENCTAEEMTHYGDNLYTDGYVPGKLGINLYGLSSQNKDRVVHSKFCLAVNLRDSLIRKYKSFIQEKSKCY